MRTDKLRELMRQKACLENEIENQYRCPSRGFDESDTFERLDKVIAAIERELNAIDAGA